MFTICIAFLALLPISYANVPCGLPSGCFCSAPILYEITCTNITVYPFFPQLLKAGVNTIRFYNTLIIDLFPFPIDDWPRLKELIFQGNTLLHCNVIHKLHRAGLLIYSDCPSPGFSRSVALILGSVSLILSVTVAISAFILKTRVKSRRVSTVDIKGVML